MMGCTDMLAQLSSIRKLKSLDDFHLLFSFSNSDLLLRGGKKCQATVTYISFNWNKLIFIKNSLCTLCKSLFPILKIVCSSIVHKTWEVRKTKLDDSSLKLYQERNNTVACLLGNATNYLWVLDLALDLLDIRQAELQLIITVLL
jgi:hypothetical protein